MFGIDPKMIENLQSLQVQIQNFIANTNAMLIKIDVRLESIEKKLGVNENG